MADQNEELKRAGLKITLPRIKILTILQEPNNQHISAEDVYKLLLVQNEEIGLATVYRVLNQFDDAGIVTRHHFEGGKSVFELAHKKHHDHLVCLKCGNVVEFEDDVIEQRQSDIAKSHKITLTNHSLYLYGECEDKIACEEYRITHL
jgi:Fur family ferric uptake transcriptional regulator